MMVGSRDTIITEVGVDLSTMEATLLHCEVGGFGLLAFERFGQEGGRA